VGCWGISFGVLILVLSTRESGFERFGTILIGLGRLILGVGVGLIALTIWLREMSSARLLLTPFFVISVCLLVAGQIVMRRGRKRRTVEGDSS
jgi:hypothetical protein